MPRPPAAIRIAFLNISPLMHDLLERAFERAPALKVVGRYTDAKALIEASAEIRPDVVVMGTTRVSVHEPVRQLLSAQPHLAVITLLHDDRDLITYQLTLQTWTREDVSIDALVETIRASHTICW